MSDFTPEWAALILNSPINILTGAKCCINATSPHDSDSCNDCPFSPLYDCYRILQEQLDKLINKEKEKENNNVVLPERFRINGYSMKDLLLFAEMCKRNDVQESDLKQAAWNIELAVRAVMNEREEIVKNMVDEITMRFTPDFKKAYEEMTKGETI